MERRLRLKGEDIEILFDALTAYCESLLAMQNRDWEKIHHVVNMAYFLTRPFTGRRSDRMHPVMLEQEERNQPGHTFGMFKTFRRHLEQPQLRSSKRRD